MEEVHVSLRGIAGGAGEAITAFLGDNPFQKAAAVSYFTLLSLAPLLLVTIAIAGLLFGERAVQGRIVEEIRGLVGVEGATVIQTVIKSASGPGKGLLSLTIGLVTLFIGTTTVFVQLQTAMNQIWGVRTAPQRNRIWALLRARLISLTTVLGVGFLLLVSLIISTGLTALGDLLHGQNLENLAFWRWVDVGASLFIITLLIAMMYKVLPDVRIAWRDVLFGAAVTSVLFTLGKHLIGLYLGRASIGSSYGAAGSFVVLMVWVYFAALIFFLGVEITEVKARRSGRPGSPNRWSVRQPTGNGNGENQGD
ncbi:MAG: YihY family inner membrane protein [Candidatus Eisenbacteria bacterium]|nr:YihY family inner membrane protein [Candidatus Latescibacterota bacterium]MBD3301200.1 YihY family inner membrane protein [Candidatus Eisenbacteria bacterium]